jgi:glycine cleavage system H protein
MAEKAIRFTENHEWIRDDGIVYTVGITEYAAEQLGDITYVELPPVGMEVSQDEEVATVESVKAASDVYAPVSGRVAAVNESLVDNPEQINKSPYGDGWFFKLEDVTVAEFDTLMDPDEYETFLKEQ